MTFIEFLLIIMLALVMLLVVRMWFVESKLIDIKLDAERNMETY